MSIVSGGSNDASVQAVLDQAVHLGLTPGVAAAVVGPNFAPRRFFSGHRFTPSLRDDSSPVGVDTVYDLASLTKLFCTTALIARAVDDDLIALDETPWPRWSGVTVAHLLQHTSGLCPHRPFHEAASQRGVVALRAGRDVVVDAVLATLPDDAPGTRTRYSDLGFIALGALLEDRHHNPLDVIFRQAFGDDGLRFVNLWRDGYHPAVPDVAPTERCPWRRRAVLGQVHDENAYAMGGVAGHAGLFGSLRAVESAALAFVGALQDRNSLLSRFARVEGERGLGFDKASVGGATGDVLGPHAVGHLGFTGTSVWLDPDLDGGTAFVLLANTVYPSRQGVVVRNKALRRAFHRAAVRGLVDDLAGNDDAG